VPRIDGPNIDDVRQFGRQVDFGRADEDYVRWRPGFPVAFFDRLYALGIGRPAQRILDVGTGTGSVARGLAARGAEVIGLDPAISLLESARTLDRESGVTVTSAVGRVESLQFPDKSFDVVTAGQCWHWFERERAAAEIHRVLRPAGRVVIGHFDWLPLDENVVAATEALILFYNPAWKLAGGTGMYPQWLTDLAEAGFDGLETYSFDLSVPYSHEAWRGRIRASAGVRASLDVEQTQRFDRALAELLSRDFPEEPLRVPHRVWTLIGWVPSA